MLSTRVSETPFLLFPPPVISQYSPIVTPACPALDSGVIPCCSGLDYSICNKVNDLDSQISEDTALQSKQQHALTLGKESLWRATA